MLTGSRAGIEHTPRDHTGRSRQGAHRERQDLGHMPVLESVSKVPWYSWAKARLGSTNQTSRVSVSSTGVFSKGHTREATGKQRRLLITGAVWETKTYTYS